MLCTPHECPNQQTPQQNFSELQDHTKKHDLNKIKKHIRYQPRTPTPPPKKGGGTSALSQHPVSPIHIITTQHTNMLCLKRIEQSTLLSSQTTHHTNNTTTHKHACSTIISRSSHDKSPQPTPPGSQPEMKSSPRRLIQLYTPTPTTATQWVMR